MVGRRVSGGRVPLVLREHQLQQILSYAIGGVASHIAWLEVVSEYGTDSHTLNRFEIGDNLRGAFESVLGFQFVGRRSAVNEGVIEQAVGLGVTIECANMIGGGQAEALIGLRHQI